MKKTYDNENENQPQNPSKVIIVPKPPKENKDTSTTKSVLQDVISEGVQDVIKPGNDEVKAEPVQPKEK